MQQSRVDEGRLRERRKCPPSLRAEEKKCLILEAKEGQVVEKA